MLVLVLAASNIASANTLFEDDFNGYAYDGGLDLYAEMNANGWEIGDYVHPLNDDDIFLRDEFPTDATKYVVIQDDSYIQLNLDTTGYENIGLEYDRRTYSMGTSDRFRILWRVGDSGSWTELEEVSDDQWSNKIWALSSADNESLIQIQFFLDDGNNDQGFLDNVVISGSEIDNDAPEIGEVIYTPEFPMCSDDVEVCVTVTDVSEIANVDLDCESSGSYSAAGPMILSGENTYCGIVSATTMHASDGVTVDCSVTAEDEHENSDTVDFEDSFTYDCLAPTADFTCTPLTGDEDLEVSCTSEATDTVDSNLDHEWSFIGGAPDSSTDENPMNIWYMEDGLYTVSLTVTDDAGHSTIETKVEYIEVLDIGPNASFNASSYNFWESESVDFTDTSTSHDPVLSWFWTFGDEENSTLQNPSHLYADDGDYNVSLTICDIDGDCDSAFDMLYVFNENPDVNAGEYVCNEAQTIELIAQATDVAADFPLVFEWDFNGDDVYDDATGQIVNYTCGNGDAVLDDTVAVRVMDNDEGYGYDEAEITISNVAPEADAGGPYEIAVYELVCFDGTATDVFDTSFTYEWDLDYDGEFDVDDTSEDPCTSYDSIGERTLAFRVHDGDGYSEIDMTTVTVFKYSMMFNLGWNLISVPLVPEEDNTSINFVFGEEISSRAQRIWSYTYDMNEDKNVWRYNEPIADGSRWTAYASRVQNVIPGYGYYILMDEEVVIYHNGEKFYGLGENLPSPPQVELTTGWNLIGHYGLNDVLQSDEIADLSGGILTDLAEVTMFNEGASPILELVPTEGYWAFITGQNNLLYAPSVPDYEDGQIEEDK